MRHSLYVQNHFGAKLFDICTIYNYNKTNRKEEPMMKKVYLCIDLKTFFASVECSERHLDPFKTNLVVADPTRGNGALCLAITPQMKSMGSGTANHLLKLGVVDMHGITQIPEEILYKEFGINAEYIIDHAWGREPATIASIKKYRPKNESINNSQVLFSDYEYEDAILVVKEMVELNVLRLVESHLVTNHISLYIGYSRTDGGGWAGGSRKLTVRTNSLSVLMDAFISLYHLKVQKGRLIRQISISFGDVLDEVYESYDLFSDIEALEEEKKLQKAIVSIRHKYGKNAILKLMNKQEKATTEKRNTLIGGHNA